MGEFSLSAEQKKILLTAARLSIVEALSGKKGRGEYRKTIDQELLKPGASFVTLTLHGALKGCIGTLKAYQPLLQDVCEHAVAAALDDYRFAPVKLSELNTIEIEVSWLTEPKPLAYSDAHDLVSKLRPLVDGVTLRDGYHQATFLPQVWEELPQPEEFLTHLCMKMGVNGNTWRTKKLSVEVYQVEHFSESDFPDLPTKY